MKNRFKIIVWLLQFEASWIAVTGKDRCFCGKFVLPT